MIFKIESDYSIVGAIATLLTAIIFFTPFQLHATTISFQDGVSPTAGYSGTSDTYLNVDQPTNNYGTSTEILIDGSPDYGTVIKWDISAVPSGESIQSASITFTVFSSTSDVYEVYEMKRDWVESQATWNEFSSGNNWQNSGAQGTNDHGTTVLGTITGSTGSQTINLNSSGIALVQSWLDNPSTNFGITIQDYDGTSDGMDFYSSEYATVSWRPTFTVQYGSSGIIESRVNANSDDAEERQSNGNMSLNSSDLELIRDGSRDQEVGMRFNNITLLQGITIANAYIQFTVDETRSETTDLTFYGDDTDNAPTFSNSSGNISSRTKTSDSLNWNNVPAWNSVGAAGSNQRTPDLSSIIQEIVDRPGWSSGNSIVIIVDGSGRRTAESYNGSHGSAPLLHIQYGTGSIGQTYFVRTDGNDTNSGTSNSSSGAWQTIQKAAGTMTAGDSVRVQPGTYYENVTPANSGTTGNSIVYKADGAVVMDGQNSSGYAFYMDGKDYIVIDGFTITNWPNGGGSHATVKFINSDNGVVRNCVIYDTGRDGIFLKGSSDNCLIENNLIYNIDDDGISPKGDGDHTIRNNTFYSCGGWAVEHTNTSGNVYENNIFWDNLDNTTGSNVTFSYNNYISSVLTGTGNISSDPLFINSSGNDFHISHTAAGQTSDSPCIDAGSATAASLGLDTRTTRTDQVVDAGTVDLGYHYLTGVISFSDGTSAADLSGLTNEYGIAWGDYNNDGYTDLYVTKQNKLYKNDGDGTFSTEPPYLYCGNRAGHWADYDNDGDLDFGSTSGLVFSINNGDGSFTMQQDISTLGFTSINNLGDFGWLDYNEDGFLDLWAPNGSNPYTYMYSNDGDGTFTGIAGSTIGLTANTNGETTAVTDYDGDGHTDILYRANNLYLWHSNGDGTFTNVTSSAGVSLSGTSGGYNGTAFGDYDNDGDLDFYGGQSGSNKLYSNDGDGTFTDVTSSAGVAGTSLTTKGVAWGDYDNDGDLDLYVAHQNGANQLFQNDGSGSFTDVAPILGLNDGSQSYGVGWADFDLDGDLDLFVGNKSGSSKLFINNIVDSNYLKVKVKGAGAGGAPIDGTGSRVELWNSAGTSLLAIREISGGEGMGSHSPRIVHFGLADSWGGSSGTYTVKIKFTGGNEVVAQNVTPDQRSITIGSTTLNHTIEVFEGSLLTELRMDECYWDGTGDEVADSTGNANHGTPYGGATITTDGKICNGGLFDGVDGYVEVPDLGVGTVTISMWINPTQTNNNTRILSNIDETLNPFGNQFALQFYNNKVQIWSNSWQDITSSTIPSDQWTHLAIVIDGGQAIGYINGVEELTQSDDYTLHKLGIGSIFKAVGGSWGNYFSGKIDEVRIHSNALTSTDIQNLMADSRTCRDCTPPAPMSWWQLDECKWEGTTNEVVDSSGNGYHGTAFGDATTSDGNVCKAGVFDGGDDYVALDMFYNQTGQITQLTGAAWVKTSVGGTSQFSNWAIVDFDRSEYFNLFIRGDNGRVGFSTASSTGTIHDHYGNTAVNDGLWHFVVGIYNGVDKIIYVDGVEDSRVVNAHGGLAIGTGQTRYGFIADGSEATTFNGSRNENYYDGAIDEVTIYDQALNLYQVQTLYTDSRNCTDCTPNAIATWYLDESIWTGATDEVIDSSGNNHHGTVSGAVQTTDGKIWRAGVFDGVDDYIEVADDPALDLVDDFTLAMWIKPTTVAPEWQGVMTKGYHGGSPWSPRAYSIYLNYDEVYISWYNSGWQNFATTAANLQTDTWYHVVYVRTSTTETIYVDTLSKAQQTIQSAMISNNENLWIGATANGEAFNGVIDEIHIFDKALTFLEVQNLFSKTHGHPPYEITHNVENFPKNRWVFLGVPVQPSPADATSVVGDDFGSAPPYWRVVRWDTDLHGYAFYQENGDGPDALPGEEPPEFAPGLGFWVIQSLHDQVIIDVDGVEVNDNYEVDLVGPPVGQTIGKNMIANPYTSRIDWSDVQVTDGSTTLSIIDAGAQGWVNSHAYVWNWQNSMYEVVTPNTGSAGDSVSVEEGFWVLQMDANKDLDLIFKKSAGQPKLLENDKLFVSRYGDEVRPMKRTELQGLTDWSGLLYLHTTDGAYTALDNRFGVDPNGLEGFDGLDASWFAPLTSEYGALYFMAPGGSELVHDIRNPEWTEQNWHFKVLDSNVNGNWQLRWPNVASIPGSIQLSLESPEGTVVVSELRDNLSYDFSLSSGSDRDFYLNAQVVEDSIFANLNIGFVQNPGISKYLDLYLFPDEPLDFMLVFVDGAPTPSYNVDPLYNVYSGSLEMYEGGQKEIVVHTMDLALNQGVDTLQYNFILSDGSAALVQAPDDQAALSIPGGFLPENSWVGIGVQSSQAAGALGSVYSIQPFGLTLPEGSELILSGADIVDLLGNANVYRETAYGRQLVQATYEPMTGTIHVPISQSGQYILLKSDEGISGILPLQTSLLDNYPNPFNATTIIPYILQESGLVSIKLYDLLGREVVELVNKPQPAGHYRVTWNGRDRYGKPVSSGVYLIHYRAGSYTRTNKLMLLK